MKHFNRFLKGEVGYRFQTLEDMMYICTRLNDMGYTWLSGKDLMDFVRLSHLYNVHKLCKISTRTWQGEDSTGLCFDDSARENYLFNRNEYEVDLI